ncbi:copia protein [Tanacetum coccineum]
MSPENKDHYQSEKEAIQLLLTGIGDEIYSTVDACKTAHDMWIAIERLQHGKSLNIQDVKTNLFWDFGRFTSHDGESMESYYSRFYKMMNEMQAPKSHKSYALPSKQSSSTRSHASTRYKGKEIAKPTTPLSESASEEDSDPEQAQRDNDMQKNLALVAKYKNDNQTGQFRNQRTVTVARATKTVGSQVVQQIEIQCFNCKEFGHFAKECRKPKRVKDYTYHKEKMLLCKQAEKGGPLQAEQADWLEDTDEEIDEQELEAHNSYMAKMCNGKECDDERVTLANLIANLKLNINVNKNIQKQLKKANSSLAHELKECKSILAKTSKTLGESNSTRDSCLIAHQNKQTKLETHKTANDHTVDYDKLECKLNNTLGLLDQKENDIK